MLANFSKPFLYDPQLKRQATKENQGPNLRITSSSSSVVVVVVVVVVLPHERKTVKLHCDPSIRPLYEKNSQPAKVVLAS